MSNMARSWSVINQQKDLPKQMRNRGASRCALLGSLLCLGQLQKTLKASTRTTGLCTLTQTRGSLCSTAGTTLSDGDGDGGAPWVEARWRPEAGEKSRVEGRRRRSEGRALKFGFHWVCGSSEWCGVCVPLAFVCGCAESAPPLASRSFTQTHPIPSHPPQPAFRAD